HRLDSVEPLRILGAAEIPGNRLVGVNRVGHGLDVRALINVDAPDRSGIFPVTSHTAVAAKLNCLENPLSGHANLIVLNGGPSAVNADEIVLAREFELHRRARLLRQHGSNEVGILILILIPKTAAHVMANDLNLILWNSQISRRV